MQYFLTKLLANESLTDKEAFEAMGIIMGGVATPAQIAAFLMALRMKGETVEEVTGFARQMRAHATKIHPNTRGLVDTCGTGGDGKHTLNISTLSALVAAAAGVPIAKHGNRAASSTCGSADLLEGLGITVDLPPEKVKESIEKNSFGFLFAPRFHASMKHAAPVRKELGVRTVFNILGPLTNPAEAPRQLLGVFSADLVEFMAHVLKSLGSEETLIVHGEEGLDEISISGKTKFAHLKNGAIRTGTFTPEDFGMKCHPLSSLQTTGLAQNLTLAKNILNGAEQGACRDAILINTGAVLMVSGIAKDIREGIAQARETISKGNAAQKVASLVAYSQDAALTTTIT